MLLLLAPPAFAVPKAFSDELAVLAVSPDGGQVLVGMTHSFVEEPDTLRVRGRATPLRPVKHEQALLACVKEDTCGEGPWYNARSAWIQSAHTTLSAFYVWDTEGWAAVSCEQGLPCEMRRWDNLVLNVELRDGDLVFTEGLGADVRSVTLRAEKLARLNGFAEGVSVYWGTDRVLVVVPPKVVEGGATGEDPVFVWVLPSR